VNRLNLGLVFGGASSEYEISLMSATSVLKNIDKSKYNLHLIGITREGKMFYYTGPLKAIEDGTWFSRDCLPCVISPDPSHSGIIVLSRPLEILRLDCIFPVLHGKNGEDGTIQGLLTMAEIPFVGCGMRASANCMDKITTHTVLDAAGVPGAKWLWTTEHEYRKDPDGFLDSVETTLGYPCFVKPSNAGSSVGVTKAKDRESLLAAMELAIRNDSRIIVEEMIYGLEVECAVLGNEEPIASPLGEIAPSNEFYDYNAKYIDGKSATYIPARISDESTEAVRSIAVKAYQALGCAGLSRVDFFVREDGSPVLNEINTIPGFTKISMYPQLFISAGLSYPALIDRLIELALEQKE
jgi:D-alanine-D-alanine ligase